jgi:hypothetical protein
MAFSAAEQEFMTALDSWWDQQGGRKPITYYQQELNPYTLWVIAFQHGGPAMVSRKSGHLLDYQNRYWPQFLMVWQPKPSTRACVVSWPILVNYDL